MPSRPGISTSSRATSGRCAAGLGHYLVPAADLGHHLQVGLQGEQRGQRAAHQRLVIGEQQPDRGGHGASPGVRVTQKNPAPTARLGLTAHARSPVWVTLTG